MNWHDYFFTLAEVIAKKSKDRSTQVGCVLASPDGNIVAAGYNGFPRGVDDDNEEWHQRPKKYLVTAHAELNAIAAAAKRGTSTEGCFAYINLPPCSQCTVALIQAGIRGIYHLPVPKDWPSKDIWEENLEVAREICKAANITITEVK